MNCPSCGTEWDIEETPNCEGCGQSWHGRSPGVSANGFVWTDCPRCGSLDIVDRCGVCGLAAIPGTVALVVDPLDIMDGEIGDMGEQRYDHGEVRVPVTFPNGWIRYYAAGQIVTGTERGQLGVWWRAVKARRNEVSTTKGETR